MFVHNKLLSRKEGCSSNSARVALNCQWFRTKGVRKTMSAKENQGNLAVKLRKPRLWVADQRLRFFDAGYRALFRIRVG